MDVNGGKLDFTATLDNSQIDAAIEETIKRVQGLSNETASTGDAIDSTVNEMQQKIATAMNTIDKNIEFNKKEIESLQSQYRTLGEEMKAAIASGNESLARDKKAAIQALDGEIAALARENTELENSRQKVIENAQAWAENQQKQQAHAQSSESLRSRMRAVREEMAALVIEAHKNGQTLDENTGRYAELREELGRLNDVQLDLQQQAKVLANDEAQIAGVINGLSGLAGGFSAVTGAVSLFAGENEDLQKVMTKLQSVMAITMGLQQLQQTLNKDSAFRLTTLATIRKWWTEVETKATAATIANTQAQVANNAAVAAGGKAAATSAGMFKLLGTAIKSIPAIGWAVAGIASLIAMLTKVVSKVKETKAAVEEMNNKIAEGATEPVSKLKELQAQFNSLGNDLNKKKKFVEDNKDAFRDLGIEVNNVKDAENVLISNTTAFVNSQMARAKAMALNEQAQQKTKELLKAQAELETTPQKIERTVFHRATGTYTSYMTDNPAYARAKAEVDRLQGEIEKLYKKVVAENNAAAKELENAGIKAATNAATKTVTTTTSNTAKTAEEILKKQLADTKSRYEQFYQWINSGDKETQAAARTEFADLVEQGDNYLDYLKKQRTALIEAIGDNQATKDQQTQMRVLNEQIANETKETILSQFDAELQAELQGAQSLIDMLEIVKRKREEAKAESTGSDELDEAKEQELDEEEDKINAQIVARTATLLNEYQSFQEKLAKAQSDKELDITMMQAQRDAEIAKLKLEQDNASSEEEKQRIQQSIDAETKRWNDAIASRNAAYTKQTQELHDAELDALVEASDAYQALFETAQMSSKKMLQNVLSDAKQLLSYVSGESTLLPVGISKELADKLKESPEEVKRLYEEIAELQTKVNEQGNYPFAGLVQGLKNLKSSAELAKKAAKEADETAKQAATDAANNMRKGALASIVEGATEVASVIGEIGAQIASLGEQIEDGGLKSLGEMMSGLSKVASSIAQGAKEGGETGAVISGVVSIITEAVNEITAFEAAQRAAALASEEFRQQLELLNLTLERDNYDNGFGVRRFSMLTDAIRNAQNAMQDYNNLVNAAYEGEGWGWLMRGWQSFDTLLQEEQAIESGMTALQGMMIKTRDYGWLAELAGWRDEYTSLADLAPELWNADGSFNVDAAQAFLDTNQQLTEEQRKQIQNVIDMHDKLEENIDILESYITDTFGTLADDAIESLTDAIINGGDAWETWREKGAKAIESIGEQLMYELFLATKFDNLRETLKNVYTQYSDPEEAQRAATEALEAFFNESEDMMNAAQQFGEDWKRYAAQHGFDIWSDEDSDATSFSGAVKTVSETTAAIISGQMNAMRVNQVAANDMLRQQLLVLNAIKSDTAFLRSIDNRLRNIESAQAGSAFSQRILH